MKTIKIFTISILVAISMNLSAQLRVLSNGNIDVNDRELFLRDNTGNTYGIGYGAYGASQMVIFSDQYIDFRETDNSTQRGLFDLNHGSFTINSSIGDFASAFRVKVTKPLACAYHMSLNGTDKFYVRGDGLVCSASGFYNYSDIKLKKNIADLNGALDKVLNMRGVSYVFIDNNNDVTLSNNLEEVTSSEDDEALNAEPSNPAVAEAIEKIKKEKQERKRVGLIAQEVEAIFPDAVRTMHDGTKAISYTDIIPLLIEAMKEQQTQIEELKKSDKDNGSKLKSTPVDTESLASETLSKEAVLYQNSPNPFTENTEIKYFLSEDVKSATLYIYNMQGNQIKSITLHNRGEANETIHGSELHAGMFIYALIADGKEIDSKRMILTD